VATLVLLAIVIAIPYIQPSALALQNMKNAAMRQSSKLAETDTVAGVHFKQYEYRKENGIQHTKPWWGEWSPNYFVTEVLDKNNKLVQLRRDDRSRPTRIVTLSTYLPSGIPKTEIFEYDEDGKMRLKKVLRGEYQAAARWNAQEQLESRMARTLDVALIELLNSSGHVWAQSYLKFNENNNSATLASMTISDTKQNTKIEYEMKKDHLLASHFKNGQKWLEQGWRDSQRLLWVRSISKKGQVTVTIGGTWRAANSSSVEYFLSRIRMETHDGLWFSMDLDKNKQPLRNEISELKDLDEIHKLNALIKDFKGLPSEWLTNPFQRQYQDAMTALNNIPKFEAF